MNWKTKTLLYYSLGGLLIGIAAGVITINNAVEKKSEVDLSLKNGAKMGIAVLNAVQKIVLK